MVKKKLTPKQKKFVAEYLIDLNATQAATRAGYSKKTAQRMGSENLSKPPLADAIQKALQKQADRCEFDADRVLLELKRIATSNLRKTLDDNGSPLSILDMDADTVAAIQSVEVVGRPTGDKDTAGNPIMEYTHKIKFWDKNSALTTAAKHFKMLTDKVDHTVRFALSDRVDQPTQEASKAIVTNLLADYSGQSED